MDKKEYMRQWRLNNKENIKESRRIYNETHKDERKIYLKENEEEIKKLAKERREKHKQEIKEKDKIYKEQHKDEILEKHREYNLRNRKKMKEFYHANKPLMRERSLKTNYGVDEKWYQEKLAEQKGVCAICGSDNKDSRWGKLNIDHSHKTKKVRGLLCHKCNTGLGSFRDDIALLEIAIRYLVLNGE